MICNENEGEGSTGNGSRAADQTLTGRDEREEEGPGRIMSHLSVYNPTIVT